MSTVVSTELILLSAGRGSRMGDLTKNLPKALLPVNGTPLIEQTVIAYLYVYPNEALRLVTGYSERSFQDWVSERNISIELAYNGNWDKQGPTGSLNVGLEKDFDVDLLMIGNGDTLFTHDIFKAVKEKSNLEGFYLVGSKILEFEQDSMLLDISNGKVDRAGKRIMIEPYPEWESSGLLVVKGKDNISLIRNKVRNLVGQMKRGVQSDGPWHEIVNLLVHEGEVVSLIEVDGKSWLECDTHQCILNAEKTLSN